MSTYLKKSHKIDRRALVARHAIVRTENDPRSPIQIGNGRFAFGADITGLQTFIPFNTMSDWGWHSAPIPEGEKVSDFAGQIWDTHGRPVEYPMPDPAHPELSSWLYSNPRRINLGRLSLRITKADNTPATLQDIAETRQRLDLWTGICESEFIIDGEKVQVQTACHPSLDIIAVRVTSPLVETKKLSVALDFPYDDGRKYAAYVGRYDHPDGHTTEWKPRDNNRSDFIRKMDSTEYHASLCWQTNCVLKQGAPISSDNLPTPTSMELPPIGAGKVPPPEEIPPPPEPVGPHHFELTVQGGNRIVFTAAFSPDPLPDKLPDAAAVFAASMSHWPAYWKSGGAVDLSKSADPRWHELERRVVLSQYLMAVNEAGDWPPQESGLVNNGWHGKFHMEMYWWHSAHWAVWNRWDILNRSTHVFDSFMHSAKARARQQGYHGVRWPKMTTPDGQESPAKIQALLIWQQPHPIFFAELDYRSHPTHDTLIKWQEVVFETADFLASFAFFDDTSQKYILGPPIYVVSENTDPKTTKDPAFELSYWRFGLRLAQRWIERLGLQRNEQWDHVLQNLAPLPVQEGLYVLHEGVQNMWTKWNYEHPALIGTYGWLPGDGVDLETLKRTAEKVFECWQYDRTWGWDFPMLAMCAARIGKPDEAIGFLLHPAAGFQFDTCGLATGGPYPYFPSNGGLLYAIAMMAAGWDGSPNRHTPGFPNNGQWNVQWEGLSRVI